jgi:hypothetical protein
MVPIINIHTEVAKFYNLELPAIYQKTRQREIIQKRQLIHYLIRKLNPLVSLSKIGRYGGLNQDHATVLNSVKATQNEIDTNPEFRREVALIKIACEVHRIELKKDEVNEMEETKFRINAAILLCKSTLEIEAILRREIDKLNSNNLSLV